MPFVAAVFCVLLLTSCDEHPTGPTTPLDTDFTLAPGESATIDSTSVTIQFQRVGEDSRCPADVACVRAGDAVVVITVRSSGRSHDYELHTERPQPARHDDLTITLVQLAPYPLTSRTIAPGDYRATLRVKK